MLAYIHISCGQIAFLLTQMPKAGERTSSKIARHLDGRPMEYGSRPTCDSCGHPIYEAFSIKHIRNMPDMAPANARRLVSRNKREGWYIGTDWEGRARRSRDYRLGQNDPSPYILFCHPDLLSDLKRGFK